MAIIIKGNVQGDVISDGGVKNETHYHYSNRHVSNQDTEPPQELFLNFYEMQYNRFCEEWLSYRTRIVEILHEDLSDKRKCNKLYALKDEVWKNLYESNFLDALKDGINIYDIHDYQKEHPDTSKTEDEIREVLALAELVDNENRPYKEKVGKYIFEHRKSLSYEDISTFFVYLDAIPEILKQIEKLKEDNCDETSSTQLPTDNGRSEKEPANPVVDAIHELTDVVKKSLEEPRTQNIYGDKNEFQDGAQLLKMGIPEGADPAEIAARIAEQQRALLEQKKQKK